MMKRIALLSVAILGFSVSAHAASPVAPAPTVYNVDGIRAEFLFNAMSKFDGVKGLEGIADCAMGTCGTKMGYVTCTKDLTEGPSEIFVGEQNQPFMTCSVQSTDPKGGSINVSYRDNDGVQELRHALAEITGKEYASGLSKSITVESIECTAHAINRDMDSIETESTYECSIVK